MREGVEIERAEPHGDSSVRPIHPPLFAVSFPCSFTSFLISLPYLYHKPKSGTIFFSFSGAIYYNLYYGRSFLLRYLLVFKKTKKGSCLNNLHGITY